MNKNKKITTAVVAGLLGISLIGGTLAWFTSTDSVTNKFATGTAPDKDDNGTGDGVEIWEDFEEPTDVVPGDETTKKVQVQNTASYDTFIRVKITKKWTDAEGNELSADKLAKLNNDMIVLNFGENLGETDGKWLDGKDVEGAHGYYYYMGKVAPGKFTNKLLESVTLSTEAGNEYRNLKFEVIVEAESIQADNNAHNDAWTTSAKATERLDHYEGQEAGGLKKDELESGMDVTQGANK